MPLPQISDLCTTDPLLVPVVQNLLKDGLFSQHVSNSSLKSLGNSLELTSQQRVENNSNVFRLTDALQNNLCVSRFYVSGSYGRRVAIGTPEIDLIVFLRNAQSIPPYDKTPDDLLPRIQSNLKSQFADNTNITVYPVSYASQWPGHSPSTSSPGATPFVPVKVGSAEFRVFLAPSLGKTTEEQRLMSYTRMNQAYCENGLSGVGPWHPSLIERPSEYMAHEKPEVQAFIRVCRYWIKVANIPSLDNYAVEVLALHAAQNSYGVTDKHNIGRKSLPVSDSDSEKENSDDISDARQFDTMHAFRIFLTYCSDLKALPRSILSIQEPASYVSPWTNYAGPVLTDSFNPFRNLLQSLTAPDAQRLVFLSQATLQKLERAFPCTGDAKTKPVTVMDLFNFSSALKSEYTACRKGSWCLRSLFPTTLILLIALYLGLLMSRHDWDYLEIKKHFPNDFTNDSNEVLLYINHFTVVAHEYLRQWLIIALQHIDDWRSNAKESLSISSG